MQTARHLKLQNETLPLDTVLAIQLIGLFRDSNRDIDEIVHFISQHPALVRETIKRCNHITFRGAERTTDVFEAVSRLGFYEVYGIVAESLAAQGVDINAVRAVADQVPFEDWEALPPLPGLPQA